MVLLFLYCMCAFLYTFKFRCILYFLFDLIGLDSPKNCQQKFANSIDYYVN